MNFPGAHPSSEGKRRRNRSNVEAMTAKHSQQDNESAGETISNNKEDLNHNGRTFFSYIHRFFRSVLVDKVEIQIMSGKVGLRCKSKTLLSFVSKRFSLKSLLTTPSNVLPKKNKNKTFKCSRLLEGDGIESPLPFEIFSTLTGGFSSLYFKGSKELNA